MKINVFKFLVWFSFAAVAQFKPDYHRFTLTPVLGVGVPYSHPVEKITGQYELKRLFKNRTVGLLDGVQTLKITNIIGIQALVYLQKDFSIGTSLSRSIHVESFSNPTYFNELDEKKVRWITPIAYYSGGVSIRKSFFKKDLYKYLQVGIYGNMNTRNPINHEIYSVNLDYESVEKGLAFNTQYVNNKSQFLEIEFGKQKIGFLVFPDPIELSIIAHLPLERSLEKGVAFFDNNQLVGTNKLSHSKSGIFLKLGVPINFKPIDLVRQPKAPKEPKIKEPKSIKPKEAAEYEGKKVRSGQAIVLKNIQFAKSSETLNEGSKVELNRLATFMDENPNAVIQIGGHTSKEGDRQANINLSERRAQACKDYLKKQGIKSKRIEVKGFGPDRPLSATDAEVNRRVEFVVLKF